MTRDVVIMAAPNGARKTKLDHAALPVSIEDTASEAAQCYAAGASVLHAHVRGKNDEHVLDAGLYRELIKEMTRRVPGMLIQVTSEAIGIYTPEEQVACIQAVVPKMASMSLREISSNFERPEYARQFFEWCDEHEVHIQHIVFSTIANAASSQPVTAVFCSCSGVITLTSSLSLPISNHSCNMTSMGSTGLPVRLATRSSNA